MLLITGLACYFFIMVLILPYIRKKPFEPGGPNGLGVIHIFRPFSSNQLFFKKH